VDLLDHLISAGRRRRRDRKPELFSGCHF